MREMTKQKITTYTMKLRLYPSTEQKAAIDNILRALHIAFNITFHHVFLKNPSICTAPKENGAVWPDWKKIASKERRAFLISENPAVDYAPAASLTTNNGLFLSDSKKAWEKTMGKIPIDPSRRKEFHFYSAAKPRHSFLVQITSKNLIPSAENDKVAFITIPKVGRIKARGFNRKLWFGKDGQYSYAEALTANELPKQLTARISKDPCGDYFVSVTFSEGKEKNRSLYLDTPLAAHKEPIGVDVGIKHIAILSTGQKIENKHFKQEKQPTLKRLNQKLSRRWGPANIAYRDYNRAIRQENKTVSDEMRQPPSQPSRRYQKTQIKKAVVERRIAQRRNTFYHQQTAALVRQSNMIAMETLLVKNMMRNHKLAYALADAAMSDFLAKITYKAERYHIPLLCIGTFEPTSQLCSVCGEKNPLIKNLGIRSWICPHCGAQHDRDINAAKNILHIAVTKGSIKDAPLPAKEQEKPPGKPRVKIKQALFPDRPELTIVFSKELTKRNDPRYVIKNSLTGAIVDDAQGAGYRSIANARNGYKAKSRWAGKQDPILSSTNN